MLSFVRTGYSDVKVKYFNMFQNDISCRGDLCSHDNLSVSGRSGHEPDICPLRVAHQLNSNNCPACYGAICEGNVRRDILKPKLEYILYLSLKIINFTSEFRKDILIGFCMYLCACFYFVIDET